MIKWLLAQPAATVIVGMGLILYGILVVVRPHQSKPNPSYKCIAQRIDLPAAQYEQNPSTMWMVICPQDTYPANIQLPNVSR